jgi:RNA polymerase sigma-70 factor (ECF subfamily)
MTPDIGTFEAHRQTLGALAYRMLGDMGRAEDMVQEAWLRWQERDVEVDHPRAYLLKIVTRLCLNELASARARREESRSDRLPEPIVDLTEGGIGAVEGIDQVSMALLVVLQRLTPAERAVLLLHDVFELSHGEIAGLVGKSEPACRQLLRRARQSVAEEKKVLVAPREEHLRLLRAFVGAVRAGDVDELTKLLAEDAVMIADGGAEGVSLEGAKNLPRPLTGVTKIAAFVGTFARRAELLELRECRLNGQPAVLALREGRPFAAVLLSVADGKIRHVFLHADPARLGHVGSVN